MSILISQRTKANAKAAARKAEEEKAKTGAAEKVKIAAAAKARIAVAVKAKTAVAAKEATKTPRAAKTEAVRRTAQATMTSSHATRHLVTARNLHQADPANVHIGIKIVARMEKIVRLTIPLNAKIGRKVIALRVSYALIGT